jgi:inositol phosphorylceramide mannosyltransferase catalytic subunit
MTVIPRIIHQTWRDQHVPAYLADLRRSWCRFHPDWDHRLCTDQDNRNLIRDRYPGFLDIYDAYPLAIQRADAVRYFILDAFGGVYADLDMQAMRPLTPVLQGRTCVFGVEPRAHALANGTDMIIGNALMASVPQHPLWANVHNALVSHRNAVAWMEPDVLRSTGPLMLTDVVRRQRPPVTVLPPDTFYPRLDATNRLVFSDWLTSAEEQAAYLDAVRNGLDVKDAYTVHHWAGTWTHWAAVKQQVIETSAPPRAKA